MELLWFPIGGALFGLWVGRAGSDPPFRGMAKALFLTAALVPLPFALIHPRQVLPCAGGTSIPLEYLVMIPITLFFGSIPSMIGFGVGRLSKGPAGFR